MSIYSGPCVLDYVARWGICGVLGWLHGVHDGQLWLLDGEAISSKVYMLTNCLVMHNCVWLKDNKGWRAWNKYKLLQVKSSYNCYCLWLWKKKMNVGSGMCDSAECCCALEQLMLHMWAMQPYQHKCSLICPLDLLETMHCDFVISNSVQSHEGTRKSIEPSKLGLGTCTEIGTCTGQYNTIVDCTCAHDMVWKPDNLTLIQCDHVVTCHTHTCTYICIHTHMHAHMNTYMYTRTHTHCHSEAFRLSVHDFDMFAGIERNEIDVKIRYQPGLFLHTCVSTWLLINNPFNYWLVASRRNVQVAHHYKCWWNNQYWKAVWWFTG